MKAIAISCRFQKGKGTIRRLDVKIGYLQAYPDVLMWEAGAEQWTVLGAMLQPRLSHAAATIELTQELLSNCS